MGAAEGEQGGSAPGLSGVTECGFARPGRKLERGRAVSTGYVRQLVKRLTDRAGLEKMVSPHTLRHTFATRFLRATGNLELTRKALRHARIQTTAEIYSHLVQEDVDQGIRSLPGNGDEDAQEPPVDPQAQELASVIASLPKEQREALVKALAAGK